MQKKLSHASLVLKRLVETFLHEALEKKED